MNLEKQELQIKPKSKGAGMKIAFIGAGSASFGLNTLASLMREPDLRGIEIALIDRDVAVLDRVERVAERMNREWGSQMLIRASVYRRELLSDSDFVIVSIETGPREKLWYLDWEIPSRHGLRQPYAENGGPGGLMHACRQIPEFMNIAQDMEQLCPDSWLINFSNPLPRITRAITKYTKIKVVSKCHQVNEGFAILASLFSSTFGDGGQISASRDPASHERAVEFGREHFAIQSAGLNHFIWLLEIRDRKTEEDLYPALRKMTSDLSTSDYPLTMDLFRVFDCFPLVGDTHLSEYLPWLHDPVAKPWDRYRIDPYDWSRGEETREAQLKYISRLSSGEGSLDPLRRAKSEGAAEFIMAIGLNRRYQDEAINIGNNGSITSLPEDAIVEVPAIVDGGGVRGVASINLPFPVVELMRREINLVELVVDAAVSGDKEVALQALLLDPMMNDIDRARAILDDYLLEFAEYLPQFQAP